MLRVKQLWEEAKESKKGKFELIVGIWTLLLSITLIVLLVFGIRFLVNFGEDSDMGGQDAGATQSPEPTPTMTPTPMPTPTKEAGGEDEEKEEEEKKDKKEEDDEKEEEETLYLTTLVNMRSSASLKASILTRIPAGSVVARVRELSDGWSKIYYDGREGYVRTEYLSQDRPQITQAPSANDNVATKKPAATKAPPKATPKKTDKPKKTKEPSDVIEDDLDPVATKTPEPLSETQTPQPSETEPPTETEKATEDAEITGGLGGI